MVCVWGGKSDPVNSIMMCCWLQGMKATNAPSSEVHRLIYKGKYIYTFYLKGRLNACLMFNLKWTCISTSDEYYWNIIKCWQLSWEENLTAIILEFYSPRVSIIIRQMIKYMLYVKMPCSYYEPLIIKKK